MITLDGYCCVQQWCRFSCRGCNISSYACTVFLCFSPIFKIFYCDVLFLSAV